jgi:ferrous iron transport protein B
MRFALVGQPNCGKSTLFNQVAGYKAETGNFAGTTVSVTESKVRVIGDVIDLVDLPGTYSLTGTNPAERVTFEYLITKPVDGIINVLDASHLAQGLALTLELLELGIPVVIGLNMMDEAARMGTKIDTESLASYLGAEVRPLVASKGRGIRNLFIAALKNSQKAVIPRRPIYGRDIEDAITVLAGSINGRAGSLPPEPLAIKLLEGDAPIQERLLTHSPELTQKYQRVQQALQAGRGQPVEWIMSGERHGLAANISRKVIHQGDYQLSLRDKIDDVLLNPFWGYVSLVVILLSFFYVVYGLGSTIEAPLIRLFTGLEQQLTARLGAATFQARVVAGVIQGISGGLAIVLPYLLPFLIGLGFLEDVGYLPRVAFMMDALMHRMGLHGKAVVPFILGYGCNVPAIMSTRMLEDGRDRFLAAALATLVPCAARLAVIFGLVAFYLGPVLALAIYMFNLLIIGLTGKILTGLIPEDSPGLILEMPVYRVPVLRTVIHKVWFRLREFIIEAWPILIVGSIVLATLNYFNFAGMFNFVTRPVTFVLGLPDEVGVPLLFGILRKELSLVMLGQALGNSDFSTVLTPLQMVTFTVFVVFYVPCLATMAVLKRELGWKAMLTIAGLTIVIAMLASLIARGLGLVGLGLGLGS